MRNNKPTSAVFDGTHTDLNEVRERLEAAVRSGSISLARSYNGMNSRNGYTSPEIVTVMDEDTEDKVIGAYVSVNVRIFVSAREIAAYSEAPKKGDADAKEGGES